VHVCVCVCVCVCVYAWVVLGRRAYLRLALMSVRGRLAGLAHKRQVTQMQTCTRSHAGAVVTSPNHREREREKDGVRPRVAAAM
jgi:hypothetical protein